MLKDNLERLIIFKKQVKNSLLNATDNLILFTKEKDNSFCITINETEEDHISTTSFCVDTLFKLGYFNKLNKEKIAQIRNIVDFLYEKKLDSSNLGENNEYALSFSLPCMIKLYNFINNELKQFYENQFEDILIKIKEDGLILENLENGIIKEYIEHFNVSEKKELIKELRNLNSKTKDSLKKLTISYHKKKVEELSIKLVDRLSSRICRLIENFHLNNGIIKMKDARNHTHAFIDYWCALTIVLINQNSILRNDILNNLKKAKKEELGKIIEKIDSLKMCINYITNLESFFDIIRKRIEEKVHIQLAFGCIEDIRFDPHQLVYWLCTLLILPNYDNQKLIETITKTIFDEMRESGGWINGKPLLYVPLNQKSTKTIKDVRIIDNGVIQAGTSAFHLYLMEPLNILLEILPDSDSLNPYLDKIEIAFNWLIRNKITSSNVVDGKNVEGWVFNYYGSEQKEPWSFVTAVVYRIFHNLDLLLRNRIRSIILKKYNTIYDFPVKNDEYVYSNELEEFISSQIKEYKDFNRVFSLLLFGPPGSGKTSIGYIISDLTNLPFVYITPNTFLKNGELNIGGTIQEVFNDLRLLNRVVVFIDEIDEFVRTRHKTKEISGKLSNTVSDRSSRLSTTAMLTELDRLRKVNSIILLASTNYIQDVDPAIRRRGRFDFVVGIGPIDMKTRFNLLKKFMQLSKINSKESSKILEATVGFTYQEIEDLKTDWYDFNSNEMDKFIQEIIKKKYKTKTIPIEVLKEYFDLMEFDTTPRKKLHQDKANYFYKGDYKIVNKS